MLTAANPWRLKRATNFATVVLLPKPACRAAAANPCPWTTASRAVARRTRSTRSLLLRLSHSNAARSSAVTARNGSFCGVAILVLLRDSAVSSIGPVSATYLRCDPLGDVALVLQEQRGGNLRPQPACSAELVDASPNRRELHAVTS